MGILQRFSDIVSANINTLLDKAENPAKMIDQYLRNLTEDLAEVKQETAGVMAEESRTKRLADENTAGVNKQQELAKRALSEGNEGDARVFLAKKQELESAGASLQTAYTGAKENAAKMRQMHDKLVGDINTLNSRRQGVKAKVAVANTQEKINKLGASADKMQGGLGAFERMEEKADRMLDEANAMNELNSQPMDAAAALEAQYKNRGSADSVDDELAAMKKEMGL